MDIIGRGMDAVFRPRSIAIFGASDDVTKIGGRPLQFLQKYGYEGAIYPINRKGGVVQTLPAYASVADVPEAPELAVVAVPPEGVLDVVRDCAQRGVRAAVILSSGFSEMGEAGSRLQGQISQVARNSGMRVVGPNCLGAIGIAERSIATFSVALESAMPAAGHVGIVSQSGNLGSFTMRLAAERGVGISRLLTTGNECDVDIADGIASLAQDASTSVILCCMETCRDGNRFVKALQMARDAGKAVVVLKVGVSEAGSEAAASHTGALAGSDAVFDAVLRRAGAIRVPSIEQLLEVGHAIAVVGRRRLPQGGRTALITASGGFGVLLADAASAQGLELPKLSQHTRDRILSVLPYASPANPVDMTAQVSSKPELLAQVLNAVAEDPVCDALVLQSAAAFHVPRLRDTYIAALQQVREKHPERLILLCCRGPREVLAQLNAMGYPTVEGIDAACATVAALVKLGKAPAAATATSPDELPALPDAAFENEANAKAALARAGLPMLREQVVQGLPQALDFAHGIGWPVVLKIVSPDIAHKTEVGGVVVGVQSGAQLRIEYTALLVRRAGMAPGARTRTGSIRMARMTWGAASAISSPRAIDGGARLALSSTEVTNSPSDSRGCGSRALIGPPPSGRRRYRPTVRPAMRRYVPHRPERSPRRSTSGHRRPAGPRSR